MKGTTTEFAETALVIVVVLGAIFIMYNAFNTLQSIDLLKLGQARGKLRQSTIASKLTASRDCFSTGEMGVLSKEVLDRKNGTDFINCAYLPRIWTYVEVNDFVTGDRYVFGRDDCPAIINRSAFVDGEYIERDVKNPDYETFKVAIKDRSEIRPGNMIITFLKRPTTLVSISKACHVAWKELDIGEYREFEIMGPKNVAFNISFGEEEVCEEIKPGGGFTGFDNGPNRVCRKIPTNWFYQDVHVEEGGGRPFTLRIEKINMSCGGGGKWSTLLNFSVPS